MLVACFGICISAFSQTPTIVQATYGPNSQGGTNGVYTIQFPEPTQAGNVLVAGLMYGDTTNTIGNNGVTDDKSNTWTRGCSINDSTNQNVAQIYYFPNSTSGTRKVTFTTPGDAGGFTQVLLIEAFNVATSSPADGCLGNFSTGNSMTSGSVTPTLTGDLVLNFAFNSSSIASTATAGSNSNITWKVLLNDNKDGVGAQYGIYNSTSAINPAFTANGGASYAWMSISLFLKAASAGGNNSQAMRILGMHHHGMATGHASAFVLPNPASGNLLVVQFQGGGTTSTGTINSMTSTNPTATATCGTALQETMGAASGISQYCYFANITATSTTSITANMSGTTADGTFMVYDITGAATSPFDNDSGGQTGDNTSSATTMTTCSGCLTPGTSSGIVIASEGHDWCTSTATTAPTGSLFDSVVFTGNSVDGPQAVDQNNGWLHFYNANQNAITATWTMNCSGTASPDGDPQGWVGYVEHFKAPAAGTNSCSPSLTLLGVGRC